jgi:ankyrin repeat protein
MSVNLTDTDKFTPLHVCADFGHQEAAKRLVERGAAINYPDTNGNTPVLVASKNGRFQILS